MKRLFIAVLCLLVLVAALLAVLALSPALLLQPAMNAYLANLDGRVTTMQGLQLGRNQASVELLRIELASLTIELDQLVLEYQPGDLLRGQLQAIYASDVWLDHRAGSSAAGTPADAQALLAQITGLPLQRAVISRLHLPEPAPATVSISVQTNPLRLHSQARLDRYPLWRGELELRSTSANSLAGRVTLGQEGRVLLDSDYALTLQGKELSLESHAGIDLAILRSIPEFTAIVGDLELLTDSLQISSQLYASDILASPGNLQLSAALQSPDALLHWRLPVDEQSLEGQLSLPLQVNIEAENLAERFAVQLSEMDLSLSWLADTGDSPTTVLGNLSELQLDCTSLTDCSGQTELDARAAQWRVAALGAGQTRLSGQLQLTLRPDSTQLRLPQLQLQVAGIEHSRGIAAATLTLDGLEISLAEQLRLRLPFASTSIEPGLAGLTLSNPSIRGNVELGNGRLDGRLRLSLDDRLSTALQLEHDLDSGSGGAELSLPAIRFSEAEPLSGLLTPADMTLDIVAGTLSGSAIIDWQPQAQGWQLSGPLTLQLDQLSGFVGDSYFVGLETTIQAQLDNDSLATAELLPASVATVDVGVSLNRIDWLYGFDSRVGTATISNLSTALLGGQVEIPHFEYVAGRSRNTVQLTLSNLELSQLVALANYPNLSVDGRISGYLPIHIGTEGITVEAGLIGALNPGGLIRYTPGNPNSSNPSVQLLNQALSNYQYQQLNANVDYDANGEMEALVELRGVNPDMNGGQPINLNVSISDNIPTLLRSLQASRVISDRLEQRLNRQ